ncbi:MAG: Modification methylase BamHI [candidate division WS2 bacterium]|nr:Modification methylase BamHI [Candidatus Lithacetigena glycinireducens]
MQAIITSPPYYLCRTYKIPDVKIGDWTGQYGREETPDKYIKHTMLWLKEAWRVLRDDGIIAIVIDDKYAGSNMGRGAKFQGLGKNTEYYDYSELHSHMPKDTTFGVKRKSLLLIPERIMIAMSDAGWIIRNKIWWTRTLPESVQDRFSSQSETIIFATKNPKYYFNLNAVREPVKQNTIQRYLRVFHDGKADDYKKQGGSLDTDAQRRLAEKFKAVYGDEEGTTKIHAEDAETMGSPRARYHRTKYDNEGKKADEMCGGGHIEGGGINAGDSTYREKQRAGDENCLFKNPGNIWLDLYLDAHRQAINELGTEGYIKALKSQILTETDLFPPFIEGLHEDHYAPFSQKLVERLILCSTRAGDVVLDPFAGSCTTLRVADRLNRVGQGIELGYEDIRLRRCSDIQRELPIR